MKKIVMIVSCIILLAVFLVACDESDIQKNDINKNNEIIVDSNNNSNPASELDDRKIVIEKTTWESFSKVLGEQAVDSDKIQVLTKSIKISGFQTTSLNYTEYLPEQESMPSNWEFNVYWDEIDSSHTENTEIRHHLYYMANGVDVMAATNGYTQYNGAEDVYTKRINNGKTAYVCLLNNNMFMRIVISNNCPDFESISQELISYAFEIKQMMDK